MSHGLRVCLGVLTLGVQLAVRPASSGAALDDASAGTTNRPAATSAAADAGQPLVIVRALYGIPGQQVDVTEKVRGMVKENAIELHGHYEQAFGDPAPWIYKSLIYGQLSSKTVTFKDAGPVNIP